MPRCDYDVVFYRVFCIALLGVAFAFTVILTNVFIDIDGLLYNKNKEKQSNLEKIKSDYEVISTNYLPQDTVYEDYETYDTERTKRSLESDDVQQIKDAQLKKLLKKQLFSYLQNLGDETDTKTDKKDKHSEEKDILNTKDNKTNKQNDDLHKDARNSKEKEANDSKNKGSEEKDTNIDVIKDIQRLKNKKDLKKNDEILHLAIHNIILQGIVGHMDLKDVYRKAYDLAKNLDDSDEKGKNPNSMKDNKFVNELMECKELHDEILSEKVKNISKELSQNDKRKNHNVIIRTLINITSLVNDRFNQGMEKIHEDLFNSKETLNGIIKLIYNGKEVKFKQFEEKTTIKPKTNKQTYVPNVYFNNILKEYLKKYKDSEENYNKRHKRNSNSWKYDIIDYLKQLEDENSEENHKNKGINNQNYRYKRNTNILTEYLKQIKGKGNHKMNKRNSENTTSKPKGKDDDELFVEIETHFDSKGMRGDRKKKLIRELVDKIQKAIHSDNPVRNNSNKIKNKQRNLHVKKRLQNPLDQNEKISSIIPEKLGHRALDPISKIISIHERSIPFVSNHFGESWKYYDSGPKFLAPSKSINSAEKNEYETEYKPALDSEIPQRLQVPLMAGDTASFYDLGNVRFLVKNIDDSGFSIGYNQFTDEQPDPESMKLFTGLENVIQTYHQKYDVDEDIKDNSEHEIVRRAIKDADYHSNEYRIIFNNDFLPYNNYQDIYNQKLVKKKKNKKKDETFVIDDSIFNKELKPAEILSLANYFNRKKRSFNVKQISNIKTKKKLNRFINTKAMTKRFFMHKKRNKRQIDKIRIIARDMTPKHSEEEIFVVSDEKILADRAVVKDINVNMNINTPELRNINEKEVEHEHYDLIAPQKVTEEHFDIITPFIYDSPKENTYSDVFSKISRHNALMSKYPHIFMDEVNKGEDEYDAAYNPMILHNHDEVPDKENVQTTTVSTVDTNYYDNTNILKPIYNDYGYDERPNDKKNYKVTVKVTPKNSSLHSGFKEVHTSINKSYNKNGLIYTSLVNVSELSKVEKANKAKGFQQDNLQKLKLEHDKIKYFIEQHKNRLEEQLALLNNERNKLEDIDVNFDTNTDQNNVNNNSKSTDATEVPPERIEDNKNIKEAKTEATTRTTTTTEAITTTTEATTTTTEATTTPNMEKLIMFNSIQKNENITNQILTKINKNNELLQIFLEKLASKLITTTPKVTKTTEMTLPEPYEQMKKMFFNNMPREVKNDTSVPFIYMYQHPINRSRQPANILYHGHIHSDAFNQFQKHNKENEVRRTSVKEDKKPPNFIKPNPNFIETPNFVKTSNYEHPNFVKTPNFVKPSNFVKPPFVKDHKFVKIPNFSSKNDTKFFLDEEIDFKVLPINTKNYYNTTEA